MRLPVTSSCMNATTHMLVDRTHLVDLGVNHCVLPPLPDTLTLIQAAAVRVHSSSRTKQEHACVKAFVNTPAFQPSTFGDFHHV